MFYSRLNQLCKQHGTTITVVTSTVLDVASSAATNWKRGTSPRSDTVIKAANHFGVTTDYLLGLSDTPTPPESLPLPLEAQQILARLGHATPAAQVAALAAMKAVLDSIDGPEK